MPRKTRKQKLQAIQRRQSQLQKLVKAQSVMTDQAVIYQPTPPIEPQPKDILISTTQNKPVSYFFLDLRKSLLFIAAIIALEIVLYFARIKW